jgi:hypothetical protein
MEVAIEKIPKSLIYEMVQGRPIYYKGYKDYLKGHIKVEQLMGSSKFQSFLITELIFLIKSFLGKDYFIFSNEIGLQFSKNSWRAADIAIIRKNETGEINDKYLSTPPEYVIEIDTKADLKEIENPLGYYQEKTEDLINFGVKKVLWIFTDTKKVMVAEKGSKKWEILDWDQEIEFVEGLSINIQQILLDNKLG